MNPLARYARWLHLRWPAGGVEALPAVGKDGLTNVPGLRVVGDLAGVPLLKFSADTGAKAVQAMLAESDFAGGRRSVAAEDAPLDLVILGAGVAGISAGLEAKRAGLRFAILEAAEPLSTLRNFPKHKPIFTYPTELVPAGELSFDDPEMAVKEGLVAHLDRTLDRAGLPIRTGRAEQVARKGGVFTVTISGGPPVLARRVIVALGRSGDFRRLGVPGEDRADKVQNRLHDASEFAGKDVAVVGGGDSAAEAAVALADAGARVTLVHRGKMLSRPKPENVAAVAERVTRGTLKLARDSQVQRIDEASIDVADAAGATQTLPNDKAGTVQTVPNDVVLVLIGREAPLAFFRRSGVRIGGEWTTGAKVGLVAFVAFCFWLYLWKSYGWTADVINPQKWMASLKAGAPVDSLRYTITTSASGPSFYYTLAYSLAILVFGIRRIRRRNTPYVTRQTWTLMVVQWLPLFILPEIILPWMGRNELFTDGAFLRPVADLLFEPYDGSIGVERAYWRAYGFILAWPLMVYNWFTDQPMWGWLVLGGLQTFVMVPWAVRRWGKGAICGWLCSCGALAETMGDAHRQKMPHGPRWNRLNLLGQGILAVAFALFAVRIYGWIWPGSWAAKHFNDLLSGSSAFSYKFAVDVLLGGILGVGLYFHFSGRMWCRFACPLAALMNIYARFTRFRIFADKKKCISCNVCTSVCHQGIDVMRFANQGLPMADPQCVRCSACVQSCPTGVLKFGRFGKNDEIIYDRTPASLVQLTEAANRDKFGVVG